MTRRFVAFVAMSFACASIAMSQTVPPAQPAHGQNDSEPPATVADSSGKMGLPRPAPLADTELEALTRDISKQLRCPVCQGESIQDSPASLAQEMKALVREQLAAGRTPDQVKAYFVARYGDWILLQPPARGLNTLLYALPVLVVIAGLLTIAVAVKKWRRAPAPTHAA